MQLCSPLASPGGKLPPQRLMRGGDRLVKECSWLNGKCSRSYHSGEQSKTFRYRCPSSVSLAGSEEPSRLPASPRGKPRGSSR